MAINRLWRTRVQWIRHRIRQQWRRRRADSGHGKRNEKGWPECEVIEEEGDYEDYVYGGDDERFRRRSQCLIGVLGFVSIFTLFCLIIWGAARPYGPRIAVQSLIVNNFYFGEGTDGTGVPTKLLTVNCSVKMMIHNPATFFGIHVSSNPVHLFYSQIAVATGQLKKYYQPRKSQGIVLVNLEGNKVPLYGAGGNIEVSDKSGGVPFRLEFDIRSQGNVVGKLVKTMHKRHISFRAPAIHTHLHVRTLRKPVETFTLLKRSLQVEDDNHHEW
ncbi:hypothetical protein TEA_010826 [Camellia sinensis var. sinensis]|uniref:Late embryogenesis abundant protein LEA-2 subgroup domain-containing protein n=1 Tax=Camellia sinensis var. sinensis TaxID=542762 RepID=A0A4V6RY03_CAMSN|nr:hypothetical protein TEA_010826 [Camellia sinensis var. sinensis]